MRVALGTIEVDDETRKKIRKHYGGKGDATRQEVKDYLLTCLEEDVIPGIGVVEELNVPSVDDEDDDEAEDETA